MNQGKIFVSHQRRQTQVASEYQSYHTFNVGAYHDDCKKAVGNLLFFNDDTLNRGASTKTTLKQGMPLLLLPLVGGVTYQDCTSGKFSGLVEAGQACLLTTDQDMEVEIANPYATELVSFLQIGINKVHSQAYEQTVAFDLEQQPDCLLPLLFTTEKASAVSGSIGKFGGRKSGNYQASHAASGVFVFVLDGVFEVQDRLLQARDGLALWDVQEVEFESLSCEAMLLLLEIHEKSEVL